MSDKLPRKKYLLEAIGALRAEGKTWEQIAAHFGVSKGAIWKFYNIADYYPTSNHILRALELPTTAVVTAIDGEVEPGSLALASKQCPKCGRHFVPNSNRKYCFFCSPYRGKA